MVLVITIKTKLYLFSSREGNKTNLFADPSQFPAVHQCMIDIKEVTDQLREHRKQWRTEVGMGSADYVTVSGNEVRQREWGGGCIKIKSLLICISGRSRVSEGGGDQGTSL